MAEEAFGSTASWQVALPQSIAAMLVTAIGAGVKFVSRPPAGRLFRPEDYNLGPSLVLAGLVLALGRTFALRMPVGTARVSLTYVHANHSVQIFWVVAAASNGLALVLIIAMLRAGTDTSTGSPRLRRSPALLGTIFGGLMLALTNQWAVGLASTFGGFFRSGAS